MIHKATSPNNPATEVVNERPFRFGAWWAMPAVMTQPHVHTDIELNLLLTGEATYFLAGRFHTILPGRMAVFWAGMPHRLTRVLPGTEYYCMVLPLAWFLAWNIERLPQRLLEGDLVQEADRDQAALDLALFSRWVNDIQVRKTQRIALLEVEARLHRLALLEAREVNESSEKPRLHPGYDEVSGRQMQRMAAYIGEHFAQPLTVEDIATAVNLHPGYAMTVFKKACGLSLWEYVTRLRISHAQRLLLTTDWTSERIAFDCGFGAQSRFYAAFKRLCEVTPRQYRLQAREQKQGTVGSVPAQED